ncbi:MAG: hypothetical protein QF441_11695 [Bacteriovoracaceae bacterium]|jgi:hypothetical protein|nr:hypothetical protein [Halobacteriovoraceae bacterium]MDP7321267.1 hypothetical protein [Bacteriovoracaceae bacterium]
MAIIEVNSHQIQFNEKNYLNLKSLIPKLQKEFPFDEYKIQDFLINGQHIDINSEDPNLIRPIEANDHIQISFNQSTSLLSDILTDLTHLTDKILYKIVDCSENFKNNNDEIALVQLTTIVDAVDIFIQSINHASSKIINHSEISDYLPIKKLQIHLLSLMKAISSAQYKKDYIMLTDLLEYELKDNLTQWKILVLPTLKLELQKNSTYIL